ncbi:icarapin-like, partial [Pogonomyrmex barbatus]|uniref:Icarapin-like n=1 Tax=Pogonomyrmex barbatus TaxID=144034 RepID=A0A6I9WTH3_9HYME
FSLLFLFSAFNKLRQHLLNYFWDMPDMSNIPEGANTTSTVKIINGHVVTINETTYSSGDDMSGTAFRIRIIDVKPLNDTDAIAGGNAGPNAGPTTVNPETPESRETVEDFNNEISKSTDTLTA